MADPTAEISMIDQDVASVQKANDVFYKAFESLDIHRMDALWIQEPHVQCIHPGWEIRSGWPDVRDSWVLIFNHTHEIKFTVTLLDLIVRDTLAWTVCREGISTKDKDEWLDGQVLATNIFERRGDEWLLIHHHGSPVLTIERDEAEEDL